MKHVLIVGRPTVGKTTLIKRLVEELRGRSIDGFFTEELREDGQRLGFWLSSLDGRQALLAHRHMESPYRVGAYKVNVALLDGMAVEIIRRGIRQARVLLLDEIGKMELCSSAFQQAVEEAIIRGPRMVATTGIQHLPFLDQLKRRKDIELVALSPTNWKTVYEELRTRLALACDENDQIRRLEQHAERICDMIASGEAAPIDLEIQQARLREELARIAPEQPSLYSQAYELRFHRLWQQFHAG